MLNEYAVSQRDEFLSLAQQLVSYDTPGQDKIRCDALADLMATQLAPLGEVTRVSNPHGGDHLCLRIPAVGSAASQAPVLLLCHYDTVWPVPQQRSRIRAGVGSCGISIRSKTGKTS